jgi:hypothetical protein
MTPTENIALAPGVLEPVGTLADRQGKTADEPRNQTAVRLLESQKDLGNLRSFVARNRANAEAHASRNLAPPRLIAESRAERRRWNM